MPRRQAPATCFSRLPRKWLACMPDPAAGRVRIVGPLVVQLVVGDGVVLDARVHPDALRVHVRADVVHRQVEADVAVEVAVERVAGVALLGAPHLLRGLGVAAEGGHAGGAVDRRVDAVHRRPVGVLQGVGVDQEVADAGLAQQLVAARDVAALAQPHAARAPAQVLLVEVRRGVDLGAHGRPVAVHHGEEGVGGGRGDDLHPPRVLQLAEGAAPGSPRGSARCGACDWNRSQYICASRW